MRFKQHLIGFLMAFICQLTYSQSGVRPDEFPLQPNPTNENFETYSQKNGVNTRASLNSLRKYFLPQVNLVPVAFIPTMTGNLTNLGQFVLDPAGDLWFIDGNGNATNISANGGSVDTLYDYSALMDYEGASKAVHINKPGITGMFIEIESGVTDNGIVIEGDDSRIWQRVFDYTSGYNVQWWSAIPNDGLDDRSSLQKALDYVEAVGGGLVIIPPGVYNVTANAIREGLYIGDHTILSGQGEVSEIRFTGIPTFSSTAILNRRASGQYTDDQQRVGNVDIHIRDLKLSMTEKDDFKNIGITLSGVIWGSIRNTWVDSVGGYSYLIGRTNDNATSGRPSQNIILDNLKATNFMDVGLEIWGADHVKATNVNISGPGVNSGFGVGIFVWQGAQNVFISGVSVQKDTSIHIDDDDRHVCAIAVGGWGSADDVIGKRKTTNVTFENVFGITDVGFRINPINDQDSIHRVDSITIRNSTFLGWDTLRVAADIRHTRTLTIEGCRFDRFLKHLQFSDVGSTSFQGTVSGVILRNNEFQWGEGIDMFGVTDFNLYDNKFFYIFDQAPITVRGGRYGFIKHNMFYNIGLTSDQWCITLNKLTASITRDTRHIEISHNTACDDRSSKHTDDLVTMYDATDSIAIKYNILECADSDADPYLNLGTGTEISTEASAGEDHDFHEVGTTSPPDAITDNIFTEAARVGLGTDIPASNLHVSGGGLVQARIESTAGQANVNIKGTSFGQLENTNGDFYITNAADSKDIIMRTESAEKLRITPSNVKSSVGLGYITEGGSATTLAGRDGSENFTNVTIGPGLILMDGMLKAGLTGQDSVFASGDSICILDMFGDTICVNQDSFYINPMDSTLCYIVMGDTSCVSFNSDAVTLYTGNGAINSPRTIEMGSYYLRFQTSGANVFSLNPNQPSPGDMLGLSRSLTLANQSILAIQNTASSTHSDAMMRFQCTGPTARHYSMGVDRSLSCFSFAENNDLGGDVITRYFGAGDSTVFLKDIQIDAGLLDGDGDYGSSGQVLSTTGAVTNWITPISSVKISDLLAATATNLINNLNYTQEWQWNTISSGTGLKISSNSTGAASSTQRLFDVDLSGINITSSEETTAGRFSNTHGGSGFNTALRVEASGGSSNYGLFAQTSGTSGYAIYASVNTGAMGALSANAISGPGGFIGSQSGNGLYGWSQTGLPFMADMAFDGSAGSVSLVATVRKVNLLTAEADGVGATLDFKLETTTNNTYQQSNAITSKWITAANATRTSDLIISGVNSGTTTTILTLKGNGTTVANGPVRLKSYTVGTLPTGTVGDTAYVTDAVTPTYLGALTGGGSIVCPVFFNGTSWVSH